MIFIRPRREYVSNVKRALAKAGMDFKVKIFDLQLNIDRQLDAVRDREMEEYDYFHYHTNAEVGAANLNPFAAKLCASFLRHKTCLAGYS